MRTVSKILAVLLAVFLLWNIYLYFTNKDTTELAVHGSIRDIISCEGHLIKSETLIAAPADGVLQPYISDCKKTGNGMMIAAILSGEANETARKQLTVIKSRVAALEEALKNINFEEDALTIDSTIDESINQIIKYAANGKMTRVENYKNNIVMLSDRKSASHGNAQAVLTSLRKEQMVLESKLGNLINEIAAPCPGVFSARLDGLEQTLIPQNVEALTSADIENIKKVKPQTQSRVARGESVCKIIDNFKWYLAVVLTDEQLGDMQKGDNVRMSFRDADGETVSAPIYSVGENEGGKRVVVFQLNRDIQGILGRRHVSIDIIRKTYEGFKLPVAALAYENDVTGVYVDTGGDRVFKPAQVLFHNDDYMILEEDNAKDNALLLYDNVVVNGELAK